MSTPMIITILSTLGIGLVLRDLVQAVIQRLTGKAKRERDAWSQRDRESRARRALEEYAHRLRLLLIDLGVDPDDLPRWPKYDTSDE